MDDDTSEAEHRNRKRLPLFGYRLSLATVAKISMRESNRRQSTRCQTSTAVNEVRVADLVGHRRPGPSLWRGGVQSPRRSHPDPGRRVAKASTVSFGNSASESPHPNQGRERPDARARNARSKGARASPPRRTSLRRLGGGPGRAVWMASVGEQGLGRSESDPPSLAPFHSWVGPVLQ